MEWSALKIAAGIVGAGILVAGLTFYFKSNQALNPTNFSSSIEDSLNQPDNTTNAPEETPSQPNQENISPGEEPKKEAAKEKAEKKETEKKANNHSAEAVKPKIEMVDPTQELAENSTAEKNTAGENKKALVSVSHILVETDATNKKYGFHYQFSQGKLHLYGNFDKGLYEILEMNGDSHTVFMYYKELYYLLDEKQLAITLLEPIKDKKLLSKLKEYRGR
jgi:type IV secretory pathway VirB10-like protein